MAIGKSTGNSWKEPSIQLPTLFELSCPWWCKELASREGELVLVPGKKIYFAELQGRAGDGG